ncbi:uncharacterized protein MONOS_1587 [Monocercomonoides exilis]|uniref:uncharacterized protein n=1 Tax=Monocercomonoides exilis TaxID=2049356 RepID=UPI00355A6E59|nr:hypothetical protein MONOS_1587 [Monocercomonoides exilis]|eukprot:MONOS_1587.1-p1 / transcript=MONOS_1587.1 / gene=MONOS_1587 / organism=Monocercomonoides_exilis_PA203 / gene_product=unspecified product / transcript_product=unspecified product / location=Mono_scaffold00028:132198-140623(+) / protein_length=2786 / sequence_SO=supercontig / SO=protein_coding / is_pseudo=false
MFASTSRTTALIDAEDLSSFFFEECNIVDKMFEAGSSLICDGRVGLASVSRCSFQNISSKGTFGVQSTSKEWERCSFSDSAVERVDCLYYGIIVSQTKASMTLMNTSICGCSNTNVDPSKRNEFDTGNIEISDASFQSVKSTDVNGGCLCFTGTSKSIVKRCIFSECSVIREISEPSGGAIGISGNGNHEVAFCFFSNCSSYRMAGGLFYDGNEKITVRDSTFESCSSMHYGAIDFYMKRGIDGTIVSNLKFELCSSSEHGSALAFDKSNSAPVVSDCLFDSCICTNNGGAITFVVSVTNGENISISYCFFSNNVAKNGNDINIFSNWSTFVTEEKIIKCFSVSEGNRVWVNDVQHNDWLPNPPSNADPICISFRGTDSEGCGYHAHECQTISFGLRRRTSTEVLLVQRGNYTESEITFDTNLELTGAEMTETRLSWKGKSENGALFFVAGQTLKVSDITLIHGLSDSGESSILLWIDGGLAEFENLFVTCDKNQNSPLVSSLISLQSGIARFKKVLFSSIEQLNCSLLDFRDRSEFEIENCSFVSIVRNVGDGSVISIAVENTEKLELNGIRFEGCKCARGNGGAMHVTLNEGGEVRIGNESVVHATLCEVPSEQQWRGCGGWMYLLLKERASDFILQDIVFSECGGWAGKNLFMDAEDLSAVANMEHIKFEILIEEERGREAMGYEGGKRDYEIPLRVFFTVPFPEEGYVGGERSLDFSGCGFLSHPCSTLGKIVELRFENSERNIIINDGFELAEVVSMAGSYEWEVYCTTNKTNVNVNVPSEMTYSYLINVESKSLIKNIAFQIPFSLSSATSLISLTSSSLTLTDCSVAHISESTSSVSFGYSIVNAQSGSLKMERFVIEEGLTFNDHSAIEFCEGMTSVICSGCNISGVVKNSGDGGWMKGTVGTSGTLTVDGCNVNGCSCVGGKGGGMNVGLKGNGKVVVNGTSVIDGCKAENNGGRGGGMFVGMETEGCGLTIGQNVEFSKDHENAASYGKDVFVHCWNGVFLESIVNTNTFAFFDARTIPSDALKLSGSENGDESGMIPLFVYLCTMGAKVIVDGSGGNGKDHNHCGFDGFGCLTIDYCANSRLSSTVNEIEVVSSSSITKEITGPSFGAMISGRIVLSDGERMGVNVSDGGSATQDWIVGCSRSLTMSRLSFVLKGLMNSRRSAFIHSNSTLGLTNCSVSFESGALTDGKIGYNVINIDGGVLIVDRFVMDGSVIMNGKSPVVISNGVELEILNSRVSGVKVKGGIGGCLNVEMKEGGGVNIEESNISSTCSGGNGMKGGGMMISMGMGGSLEMKNIKFEGCKVPTEDVEDGGRGMGGGMFVKLADEMETFVMEGMEFEGCNAWKGKNVFVSGLDLSEIVNEKHLKWEIKEEELGSLDQLCGWERKTTGEGYVIPLVVYLWSNWSGNGFVSKDGGGDFSGCGFSEAPCSSIDHLKTLRYSTLGEGETHISIVGSGLLSHSISFSSSNSSTITVIPRMVIEGTKKGTGVVISDEDENDLSDGSMISSNVNLILTNLSFLNPNPNSHHEILIESSGTNICLSVVDCSFGSLRGITETTGFCVMKVNGGRVIVQGCSLDAAGQLRGFIAFSAVATREVTVEDVNISNRGVKERSLISMFEDEQTNEMKAKTEINRGENGNSNNEKVVIKVNGSSFTNITNGENRAGVLSVDSFARAMECVLEGCSVSNCRSEMSEEGGGMKVCLKRGESEVRVVGCSLGMCSCSGVEGRGGGVMVDALDPNECGTSGFGPVGIRMENVRFWGNEAFVGKDVFIRCESIAEQINETLFVLDLSQDALKSTNSICGSDKERDDVDLIPLITFYYGQQVFVSASGRDDRQCGAQNNPCLSIGSAVKHIQKGVMNAILIDGEGVIGGECVIGDMNVKSLKKTQSTIHLDGKMEAVGDEGSVVVFVNESAVEKCEFLFGLSFESEHSCIVKVKNGTLGVSECWWKSVGMMTLLNSTIVKVEGGELEMEKCVVSCVSTSREILSVCEGSKAAIYQLRMSDIESEDGGIVDVKKARVEAKEMSMSNIARQNRGSIVKMMECTERVDLMNCSMRMCLGKEERGWMVSVWNCECVNVDCCEFDGEEEENEERSRNEQDRRERREETCKWNGSMVEFEKSEAEMKVTSMRNSKKGGLSVSGGNVVIEKGEFANNNPLIGKYPSARRNILCSDSAQLNIMSLKGGDGQEKNTSLWILNDGCSLMGIVEERASPLFIPTLRSVETEEKEGVLDVVFRGTLLLPCNLSFRVVSSVGDVEQVETHEISESGFVSEEEVHGTAGLEIVRGAEASAEVRVCILFGDGHSPSVTESFILKNRSEVESKGDEKIVESGKKEKSFWPIIVIVLVVILLIVLVVSIVVTIRWRRAKNENKGLREIVNDNIRKDPKLIEMVTMEMSPEEQWRRAEREAEKKNEEKIKKRVYGKQMQHSESSEHLLSESGSTEYILGRDSDKIPEWVLEKVDEKEIEEETRKRTPSPSISSISSTSTTDTSDTDTTFVRSESMCPTTSSMSNLVDAMACSSPHEKLIVDLRDSLFMLIHGRNEKKEMAIGTLQEREMTAAQILFWVANGALHSFKECEVPLQSLSYLSPHIVLFSEHMVICIVLHSNFLSDDDSDSSSISSTVVTSASDDDDSDSLPSSAFEDEDDFKKECLRWKAPELMNGTKNHATKKTVVFSIGMMLWECLTLQIPFGEYPAEVAGQKIVNGERPDCGSISGSGLCSVVKAMLSREGAHRPSLEMLKREYIKWVPGSASMLTVSDAIGAYDYSDEAKSEVETKIFLKE